MNDESLYTSYKMNKKIKSLIVNGIRGSSKPHLQIEYALLKLNKIKRKEDFEKMKKWFYRPCYGDLFDSISPIKEFDSLYEMLCYLSNEHKVNLKSFCIHLYLDCLDSNFHWEKTYFVCLYHIPIGYCTEK